MPNTRLQHILDEADLLVRAAAALSREEFDRDPILQRAFTRSLEIIGEAAKSLPVEFRHAHPEIEWHLLAGMQDPLIHRYFAVDYDVVWNAVTREVPPHAISRIRERCSSISSSAAVQPSSNIRLQETGGRACELHQPPRAAGS